MNALDLAIVLVATLSMVAGYRLGLLTRVLAGAGLVVALLAVAANLERLLTAVGSPQAGNRIAWIAGLFFLAALAGKALGAAVGRRIHRRVFAPALRRADRIAGAGVAGASVGVLVWLLVPLLAAAPGWPADQAASSTLATLSRTHLPSPPAPIRSAQRLIGAARSVPVPGRAARDQVAALAGLAGLGPPAGGDGTGADRGDTPSSVDPDASRLDEGLDDGRAGAVARSVMAVSASACAEEEHGSGFLVARGRVVTNAHVVAGARQVSLTDADGARLRARVVAFDRRRDLALLAVDSPLPALELGPGTLRVGDGGAPATVYGHPGGRALRAAPARVRAAVVAIGRDLYDREEVRRDVLVLDANLGPGDSGAPVVGRDGTVVGLSFAVAPDDPGTAFALDASEIREFLAATRDGELPSHAGGCVDPR